MNRPVEWKSLWEHTKQGRRPKVHPPAPEAWPLAVFVLAREEKLESLGRVWDPSPSAVGLSRALAGACPNLECLHYPGESWVPRLSRLPAPAIISSPDRRTLADLAVGAIEAGAEYMAFLADAGMLSGRRRWDLLYSRHPASRVLLFVEAWTATPRSRAGSPGGWRPACWIVWDGKGRPIKDRPPTPTVLKLLPDSNRL